MCRSGPVSALRFSGGIGGSPATSPSTRELVTSLRLRTGGHSATAMGVRVAAMYNPMGLMFRRSLIATASTHLRRTRR